MSNKLATVFIPIRIKSIKDAETFLSKFRGRVYIPCDDIDLCIETWKDGTEVSWRWKSERGNIFSPYFVDDDGAYCVYHHRKYVNAWQKSVSRMY